VLGEVFDHFGWTACVAGIGASLAVAAWLAGRLGAIKASSGVPAARDNSGKNPDSPGLK
jgi:MFS transporter, YNFM family, putative membrane transport protein